MKLEDQLTNLELSKKIESLGVKQDSLWWWKAEKEVFGNIAAFENKPFFVSLKIPHFPRTQEILCSAFTCAELGSMLPSVVKLKIGLASFSCQKIDRWWLLKCQGEDPIDYYWVEDKSEANARAKMLVWLIENNHVKAEDLNG